MEEDLTDYEKDILIPKAFLVKKITNIDKLI